MNQFKKAQVMMLPTNNESLNSVCCIRSDKPFLMSEQNSPFKAKIYDTKDLYHTYFNLYIISNDEIKEGDWKYNSKINCIVKHNRKNKDLPDELKKPSSWCKKIIATTDNSLNTQVLNNNTKEINLYPQPSQQFIEKYIESYNKDEVITDVLVEYEANYINWKHDDKIEALIDTLELKTDNLNTISIKPIKDSWNREEVENILYKHTEMMLSGYRDTLDNWIKEYL